MFIRGMQISHPLYKHLLKHDITQMSETLSRAQPYIQLEEEMKSSTNQSLKCGNNKEKLKSQYKTPTKDRCSRFSYQIHSKPSRWKNISLHFGSLLIAVKPCTKCVILKSEIKVCMLWLPRHFRYSIEAKWANP